MINKSSLHGSIRIPPSKSQTLRALTFAFMAKGRSRILHYLDSPDTWSMVRALELFGCKIHKDSTYLDVIGCAGKIHCAEDVIDCGNSGQVLRFLGALSGLNHTYTIFTGDHSIRHSRPVLPLLGAMKDLGAFAESMRQDGLSPIIIKGPMSPGFATLSGEDSQPVSALLIACSFLEGQTQLTVTNPGEKPWIDLTLHWLTRCGIAFTNHDYKKYVLFGGAHYNGFSYEVPGDLSSASFPIVAALVTKSELLVENIDLTDKQGDKKLITILQQMGAQIEIDEKKKTVLVKKNSHLQGKKIDINDCIDTITILAVVGCYAEGTTEIVNASIARKKESDRIYAIVKELRKMGADMEEKPDGIVIRSSPLHGALVFSHKDHRMAMSLSVAGLGAKGDTIVEDVECVNKTFPSFLQDFQHIKGAIQEYL